MEKSDLMEDFSRFNVPDITNAQGWEAFSGSRRIGDFIVGASTGTSGNRGLFVISHGEQFSWLGAILAKAVPDFWLCPALVKKDRFDLILEKATELGVARIRPVVTRRCVVDKLNAERARTVTVEAAEQCARPALPIVDAPDKLDTLLRDWPQERHLFFADEEGGEPAADAFCYAEGPAALLVGPEGGFDDAERAAIRAHPASVAISLGPRILRGETAAIAGTAVWMAEAGDWLGEE